MEQFQQDIEAFISKEYAITNAQIEIKNEHNSNINALVWSEKGNYFLKAFGSEEMAGCQFEIDMLKRLNSITSPIRYSKALCETPFTMKDMPLISYELINGLPITTSNLTEQHIASIAKAQAQLHGTLRDISECPKERFMPDDLTFTDIFTPRDDTPVNSTKQLLGSLYLKLNDSDKTVIHDDMSMDNIIVADDYLYLIDFSDAHISYRISDVANTIKELIIDNLGLDTNMIDLYLETYSRNALKPLSEDEIKSLPYLYLRRALFMYCYYGSKEDPVRKIQAKTTRQLKTLKLLEGNMHG